MVVCLLHGDTHTLRFNWSSTCVYGFSLNRQLVLGEWPRLRLQDQAMLAVGSFPELGNVRPQAIDQDFRNKGGAARLSFVFDGDSIYLEIDKILDPGVEKNWHYLEK